MVISYSSRRFLNGNKENTINHENGDFVWRDGDEAERGDRIQAKTDG